MYSGPWHVPAAAAAAAAAPAAADAASPVSSCTGDGASSPAAAEGKKKVANCMHSKCSHHNVAMTESNNKTSAGYPVHKHETATTTVTDKGVGG